MLEFRYFALQASCTKVSSSTTIIREFEYLTHENMRLLVNRETHGISRRVGRSETDKCIDRRMDNYYLCNVHIPFIQA